jgi:porin
MRFCKSPQPSLNDKPLRHGQAALRPARLVDRALFCGFAASAGLAAAEEDFMSRETLTGDWFGVRNKMAECGFAADFAWTQFAQGLIAGDGNDDFELGGRVDALFHLNTEKLGLWAGGGFHAHVESRFGQANASRAGAILPVNTGLLLPVSEYESVVASSLFFTQKFGDFSMMLGKINAVDLVADDPFYGGWGNTRFMNIAFVAPPSGLLPPVLMGAVFSYRMKPFTLTFMAYDPSDQTPEYSVDQLFNDGLILSLSGTWSGEFAGRPSSLTFGGKFDTGKGTNLREVLLSPNLKSGTKDGSFSISLDASHLLYESPDQEGKGLGVYLKTAIADGNPNPIQASVVAGFSGHHLIPDRPLDVFGLGYFYYGFSNELQNTVAPLLRFDDEQGVELFYNLGVTPWFHVTADLQWINPANAGNAHAVVGALRTQMIF